GMKNRPLIADLATYARGEDGRLELSAAAAHHLGGDAHRRAARSILLLGVVTLLDSGGVLRKLREQLAGAAGEREHSVRARREIRRVHAADPGVIHSSPEHVQPIVPPGRPDYQIDVVVAGQGNSVVDSCGV